MHKYRFFLLDWHLKFWCCRHGDIDNTDQSETKWFLLLDWIKLPCVLGNSYYLCIIFVLSSNYLFLFSRLGQVALYVGAPWQQQWTSSLSWESSKGKGVLSCPGCFGQYLYGVITLFAHVYLKYCLYPGICLRSSPSWLWSWSPWYVGPWQR